MFDKWFNQDIEKVLSKRNRVAGDSGAGTQSTPDRQNDLFVNYSGGVCGLWPSGETGADGYSGYMLRSAVSPNSKMETSAGVKLSREVVMKTGRQIQMTKTIIGLNGRLKLKIGIIVAAVAGCLLAVPLTRAHNHWACEQTGWCAIPGASCRFIACDRRP